MARLLTVHKQAQTQFRLKQQQLGLATVTGTAEKIIVSDYVGYTIRQMMGGSTGQCSIVVKCMWDHGHRLNCVIVDSQAINIDPPCLWDNQY